MNMSQAMFVSPDSRFVDSVVKATCSPSPLIAGKKLEVFATTPALLMLISSVAADKRSRTNTCGLEGSVARGSRFVAEEVNATNRPSALIDVTGELLAPDGRLPPCPELLRSTRSVVRAMRSRTKKPPLGAPATRLLALDAKTTNRPLAEI